MTKASGNLQTGIPGCLDSGSTHWFNTDFCVSLMVKDTQVSFSDAVSVAVQQQHVIQPFPLLLFQCFILLGLNAGWHTFLMGKGRN